MSQNKQQEIAHDSIIKESAEFFWGWSTPAGRLRAERRARMIIAELQRRNMRSVLEIGSGTGIFTQYLYAAGLKVSGIDISWELLVKAKEKCSRFELVNLSVADVENLPFSDGSFDAACGVCVLHHLDVKKALLEIYRVLKKGGLILFSEPNMVNPQLFLQKSIKFIRRLPILGETEDETAFYRWQLNAMLETIGFQQISIMPFDFLHPWTPKPFIPVVRKIGLCFERIPVIREISGSLFIKAVK